MLLSFELHEKLELVAIHLLQEDRLTTDVHLSTTSIRSAYDQLQAYVSTLVHHNSDNVGHFLRLGRIKIPISKRLYLEANSEDSTLTSAALVLQHAALITQ